MNRSSVCHLEPERAWFPLGEVELLACRSTHHVDTRTSVVLAMGEAAFAEEITQQYVSNEESAYRRYEGTYTHRERERERHKEYISY